MCYNLRNFVNDSKEFSLQGMFINCLKIVVITPKVATYTSGEPSVDCSSRSTPVTTRNALPMSNTTDKRGHCGVSADQASKRQMNSDARVNAAEDPTAQTIRRWQPQTVHYHCAPGVTVVNAPGVTVKNFITAPAAAQAAAGVQEAVQMDHQQTDAQMEAAEMEAAKLQSLRWAQEGPPGAQSVLQNL